MSVARLVSLVTVTAIAVMHAPGVARAGAATKPPAATAKASPKPAERAAEKSAGKAAAKAAKAAAKNPTVVLYHINRKETLALRLRDGQGKPVKGLQKRFNKFLRCHYTNQQHAMDPRLMRLVYQTGRHWPGRRIEVVSGYRHPTVAKNPRSPHMKGLACDFRVAGVQNTELRDYLRTKFEKVGVGYYPNSSFVHLDVRKDRSAFWIDYSGPGDRAMYSETPYEDLKNGRAESFKPTRISGDWINDAPPDRDEGTAPTGGPAAARQPAGDDGDGNGVGLGVGSNSAASGRVQPTALPGQPAVKNSATP